MYAPDIQLSDGQREPLLNDLRQTTPEIHFGCSHGLSRVLDHGSDFTSQQLEQVAADLRFELVYSAVARTAGPRQVLPRSVCSESPLRAGPSVFMFP
jgi:transposase InsO family protein